MHLLIVNFLRLLHILCLLHFVEGRTRGIANPDRDILTEHLKFTVFDIKMLQELLHRTSHVQNINRGVSSDNIHCSTALCRSYHERLKRSASFSESSAAQTKQKDDDDNNTKNKQTISQITSHAFGNPSLPDQSKKGKKRPKPKRPRG